MDSIKEYLSSDGTCKCGLECPLQLTSTFSFNTKVVSIKDTAPDPDNKGKIKCKHKARKRVPGVSSYQLSRTPAMPARHEVSTVTSSAMMSPRVSSTLQENVIHGNSTVTLDCEYLSVKMWILYL